MVDRDAWTAPSPPPPRGDGVPGALYGSRLFDQPAHAATRARIHAFLDAPGPVVLEIGFDHGIVLLDAARTHPQVRYLGAELRRRRVDAVQPHVPGNCLALRADARTLLAGAIPAGRLDHVLIEFPTPALDPHHLLLTPQTVALIAAALAPRGSLTVVTDVPAMAALAERLLDGWPPGAPPPLGDARSRRARVCARDGLPTWRLCRRPPVSTTTLDP